MLFQIFLSLQVKRCAIIIYKHGIYELPHKLLKEKKTKKVFRNKNQNLFHMKTRISFKYFVNDYSYNTSHCPNKKYTNKEHTNGKHANVNKKTYVNKNYTNEEYTHENYTNEMIQMKSIRMRRIRRKSIRIKSMQMKCIQAKRN